MNARSSIDSGGDGKSEGVAMMALQTSIDSGREDSTAAAATRVVLRESAEAHFPHSVDGAWWPRTRSLADELPGFFTYWPTARGRISRILYSRPDWDDSPHSVNIPGRRIKTGSFPRDDTHRLILTLGDRTDRVITVIAPQSSAAQAAQIWASITAADGGSPTHPVWDNEGGRPE